MKTIFVESAPNFQLSGSRYLPELDGLRGLAVALVVGFHAFPTFLQGGFIGVDVFFVITGFLITTQLLRDLDSGQFSLVRYAERRVRRLFPALLIVCLTLLLLGWFTLLADEYAQLAKHLTSVSTFTTNITLLAESGYFDNASVTKPLLHLWSLAVEMQFYLLWPVLLWVGYGLKINPIMIISLVSICSFLWSLNAASSYPIDNFYRLEGRLWEFLGGATLSWLVLRKEGRLSKIIETSNKFVAKYKVLNERIGCGSMVLNLASFTGILLLCLAVVYSNEHSTLASVWIFFSVLGSIFLIGTGSKTWLNQRILNNRVVIFLGLISYPLYLWHWPLLSFLQILSDGTPSVSARVFLIIVSLFLAWLTYRFIETPIRNTTSYRSTKSALLVSSLALVGTLGFLINSSGGVTPNNLSLKKLSDAKGDWDFPGDLVRQDFILSTSHNPPSVLMIGDSHIQAFGPRVVDLYQRGESVEIGFITHCAPIPILTGCAEAFSRVEDALREYPIKTVILGGSLDKLLNTPYPATVSHQGRKILVSSEEGRELAISAFVGYVRRLSAIYEVVVVSPAAASPMFAPSSILTAVSGKYRSIPLKSDIRPSPFSVDTSFEVEMSVWLKSLEVTFVSQSERVCPGGVCFPLTDDGRPKYKDSSHMRPFFVREHMDILDPFIRKSPLPTVEVKL